MVEPAPKWTELYERAAETFTPSAPIDVVDLFAGRWSQLTAIKDAVITKGQHGIIFGERGVGKTSLVSVVGALLRAHKVEVPLVIRENCGQGDTYAKLWKRALAEVVLSIERKRIGFDAGTSKELRTLAERVSAEPGTDEIVALLRNVPGRLVFVFDEFDQLPDAADAAKPFADTIKAMSDYAVPSTVLLVGVGDSVSTLLEAHASVDRALIQIPMPRMAPDELAEVLTKVSTRLGMTFEPEAAQRVVDFSQGLPHYTHLIGLHSSRWAIERKSLTVGPRDVEKGVEIAVSKVPRSTLEAYRNAVDSPHSDALFRQVLLACALTGTDDRGTFAPGDIRPALKTIGHELEIPAFAPHLTKFASAPRGEILDRIGQERRFRYRFRNPLMQPYVIMRGLADGLVTQAQIHALRGPRRSVP